MITAADLEDAEWGGGGVVVTSGGNPGTPLSVPGFLNDVLRTAGDVGKELLRSRNVTLDAQNALNLRKAEISGQVQIAQANAMATAAPSGYLANALQNWLPGTFGVGTNPRFDTLTQNGSSSNGFMLVIVGVIALVIAVAMMKK